MERGELCYCSSFIVLISPERELYISKHPFLNPDEDEYLEGLATHWGGREITYVHCNSHLTQSLRAPFRPTVYSTNQNKSTLLSPEAPFHHLLIRSVLPCSLFSIRQSLTQSVRPITGVRDTHPASNLLHLLPLLCIEWRSAMPV